MKQIIVNNISTSYYITETGECYNQKTGKFLKGRVNPKNGYKAYKIRLNGKPKMIYAHRLVAIGFISNPKNKEQVNHIDGDKLNNYVDNLEWVTPKENMQHALKNELIKHRHVFCFLVRTKELVAEYKTINEASRATNINRCQIKLALEKQKKSPLGGFYWSYEKVLGEVYIPKFCGKAKVVYQYDLKGKFITSYNSAGEAGRALGAKSCQKISECCRGKIKSYKGFIFRYREDVVLASMKVEETTSEVV